MESRKPLISIIVPIYKVADYLPQCIESVTGQSYENIEIILVDDGSPDSCGAICDQYAALDSRIKVIHQANQGVSVARNQGIDSAQGEWIAFLDGDDSLCSDALLKAVDAGLDKSVDIYTYTAKRERKDGSLFNVYPIPAKLDNVTTTPRGLFSAMSCHIRPVVWGGLYNKEFILREKLRFLQGAINSQDTIFALVAYHYAKRVSLHDIDFCMINYREGSASRSWSEERMKSYINNFKMIDHLVKERGIVYRDSFLLNRLTYIKATYFIAMCIESDLSREKKREIFCELKNALKQSGIYPINRFSMPIYIRGLVIIFNLSITLFTTLLKLKIFAYKSTLRRRD